MHITRISSAYRLILCSVPRVFRPDNLEELRIVSASGSIRIAKIIGDRGQPCLVPLVMGKKREKNPEVETLADVAV